MAGRILFFINVIEGSEEVFLKRNQGDFYHFVFLSQGLFAISLKIPAILAIWLFFFINCAVCLDFMWDLMNTDMVMDYHTVIRGGLKEEERECSNIFFSKK